MSVQRHEVRVIDPRTQPFGEATMIAAEGARVAVVTCRICGGAILLDPRDEWANTGRHLAWHALRGERP